MIVYACTAALSGYLFDRYDNYDGVILGVALGMVLTGFGLWAATRRPPLA